MNTWELQVRVIAAYGPMKGREVWQTMVRGVGYQEDAENWINSNRWVSKLGNLNIVLKETTEWNF
jgi:hypothetical protein